MDNSKRFLMKGNEAVVYGALLAGCDAYYGYPITPASEIAEDASLLFPKLNRVFLQAESEIGAINMVIGASAAGKRVMTASSGLGISLKQEGVSYLAAYELPCVIVDVMRAGPGLGNIGPEQSDYSQIVKGGGHGGYHCLVFAPDCAQEMCDFGYSLFDLCEKYHMPAYILTDGVIGQMMETVTLPEPVAKIPDLSWSVDKQGADGANHFTTLFMDYQILEARNKRIEAKYAEIREKEQRAEEYLTDDAEIVLVAYGISSRVARTAVDNLRAEGVKAGLLRPITLWPFPEKALRKIAGNGTAKAFLSVELSAGQLIDDVRLYSECRLPVGLCGRTGGNIPSVQEVCTQCRKMLGKEA